MPQKQKIQSTGFALSNMTSADFKAELLAALREEMADIFKAEMKTAMADNFNQVKSELQSVRTELNAKKGSHLVGCECA